MSSLLESVAVKEREFTPKLNDQLSVNVPWISLHYNSVLSILHALI